MQIRQGTARAFVHTHFPAIVAVLTGVGRCPTGIEILKLGRTRSPASRLQSVVDAHAWQPLSLNGRTGPAGRRHSR